VTFSVKYVPSCWPPHFAVAPVTNYSVLDAWLSQLHADCSALHVVRPVPVTDLTRCSTLSALCLLRIAPHSILCARAGRGSLRATDCSVVQHLELCTACGLLRTRYLAFRAVFGLLRTRRFPLCAAHRLLRARRLALHAGLRIAPYADILRPVLLTDCSMSTLSSAPPQISLRPTLGALRGRRIAPLSLLCAPC
jgi:hypothetical protein